MLAKDDNSDVEYGLRAVLEAIVGDILRYCNNKFLTTAAISGKADKATITAGIAGTKSATSGYTIEVPWIEVNSQGIVTAYGTHTHTVTPGLTTKSNGNITFAD